MISATVQMIGDLTAMIPGVPPLGGVADAVLRPFYEDTLFAWMVSRSLARATNSGWTRYFEYFQEGAGKAYTISALMVLRAGFWATRSFAAHEFGVRDGAPYLIGAKGHLWLGKRGGYTIRGDKSHRIYMDRVSKVSLTWSREEAVGWTLIFGDDRALQDPAARIWERIEAFTSSLQQVGF